jgi:hypothetical protein
MNMCFILKNIDMKERHITMVLVLKDRLEFEVDYYGKLEEVVELQYYSEHNRVFLFKCY